MKKLSVIVVLTLSLIFSGCAVIGEVEKSLDEATSEMTEDNEDVLDSESDLVVEDKAIDINIGDVVTVDEWCEFQVQNVEFSKEVEPSYPVEDEYYYYYEPTSDTNMLLDIKCSVKNLDTTAMSESDFYSVYAIYDGKYEYMGTQIYELADGSDLEDYVVVQPLETVLLHTVIEVPLEVAESDKSLEVYFESDYAVHRLKVK